LVTKTETVKRPMVPRLALLAASGGDTVNVLVHPDQVGAFVLAHTQARFVTHDVATQFWVIERHLHDRGEDEARTAWWDTCDQNRMASTLLLDQLIALAKNDSEPTDRGLGAIAQSYTRLQLSGNDPCRRRYGEMVGADWDNLDESF